MENTKKIIQFPHMDEETYLDRYNLAINDRLSYWSARAEEFLDWDVFPKKVEQIIDGQRWPIECDIQLLG